MAVVVPFAAFARPVKSKRFCPLNTVLDRLLCRKRETGEIQAAERGAVGLGVRETLDKQMKGVLNECCVFTRCEYFVLRLVESVRQPNDRLRKNNG